MRKSKPFRFKPEEVSEALVATGGNISKAAHHLNCGRQMIYEYMKRHETIRIAMQNERERRNDIVEDKLFGLAEGGNLVACIFWAKTQMRDRGFIERDKMDYREVLVALGHDPDKVLSTYADNINKKSGRAISSASESVVQRV